MSQEEKETQGERGIFLPFSGMSNMQQSCQILEQLGLSPPLQMGGPGCFVGASWNKPLSSGQKRDRDYKLVRVQISRWVISAPSKYGKKGKL